MWYLKTSGPPEDLEMFARRRGHYATIPDPPNGLPYMTQAQPIPDFQQKHVSPAEVNQAIAPSKPNPLVFGRFTGTSQVQRNTAQFQSVNEQFEWD